MYFDCEKEELLKVITQEEFEFIDSLRIPFGCCPELWAKKWMIDEKVGNALDSGQIKPAPRHIIAPTKRTYIISDYLPDGSLKSMADGKMYDSKSQYYRSLKEAGMVVVGNDKIDSKPEVNEVTGRDIKDAIERIRAR